MTIKVIRVAERHASWRSEQVAEYGLDFAITDYTYPEYAIVKFADTVVGSFDDYVDAFNKAVEMKRQLESTGLHVNIEVKSVGKARE